MGSEISEPDCSGTVPYSRTRRNKTLRTCDCHTRSSYAAADTTPPSSPCIDDDNDDDDDDDDDDEFFVSWVPPSLHNTGCNVTLHIAGVDRVSLCTSIALSRRRVTYSQSLIPTYLRRWVGKNTLPNLTLALVSTVTVCDTDEEMLDATDSRPTY